MGTQTLLEICNRVGALENLPVYASIYSNPDPQARLLLECAQQVGEDLCERFSFDWNIKYCEKTVTVAAENLGPVKALLSGSGDFEPKMFPKDCFWDLSRRIPLSGPLSAAQRQSVRIFNDNGGFFLWWIENQNVYTKPAIPVGHVWSLYARSNQFVDDGSTQLKARWNADTNIMACSDGLFFAGVHLKWRERNQFPYEQEFLNFERKAQAEVSTTGGGSMELSLDSQPSSATPGIIVVGIPVPPA